jgi:hypothetical protein
MTIARRARWLALFAATGALAACGGFGNDSGGGGGGGGAKGAVTLTWLVDNSEQTLTPAKALASAFHAKNPNISIKIETRPQGGDGDNVVKTRLATGDMDDMFSYNSGSLLQALKPQQTMTALNDEPWVKDLDKSVVPSMSSGGNVYGAPFGGSTGAQDVGAVHGQQRQAQGPRDRPGHPDLPGHVDLAATHARGLPQHRLPGSAVGVQVHGQPGEVLPAARARELPAPPGGAPGRV